MSTLYNSSSGRADGGMSTTAHQVEPMVGWNVYNSSPGRADGLVECLQQLIRSSRWLGGMSTTALQNRGPIMNFRRHEL